MALQIWLPLDGTLENKGCANVEMTNNGAIVDTTGKIGSCYSFSSNAYFMGTPAVLNNETVEWSFACWFKPLTSHSGCLYSNRTSVSNTGICVFYYKDKFLFDDGIRWEITPSVAVSIGEWNHIAFTKNSSEKRLYLNGALINSTTTVGTPTKANASAFAIGMSQNSSTTVNDNAFNGYLNDIRLYDHCLSAAEVHEIAQGLVLHYKLDNDGFGNKNLVPCGGTYTKHFPWTTSFKTTDGFKWITNSAFEAIPSTTYTISVECDGNISNSHKTGGDANPIDKLWALFIYICNTDTQKNWADNQYDTAVLLHSANNNYRKIGNTHVWTITLTNNQKYISLRTNTYSDGETPVTVNWWNIKVEEGSEFTPWGPSSESSLYNAFGLNKGKITDSSGYGRHGKSVGTIQYFSDTAKYKTSYVMDGNHVNRIVYNENTFNYTDNFSYTLWVKPNHTGDSAQYIFTNGRADAGGYGYGLQSGSDTVLSARFGNKIYSMTVVNDEWVHVAFTKSGNTIKLYKNGALYSTNTFDGTLPTYSDGNGLGLGNFHYTGDIYPAYGNISDFRIYSTPLSAEDILQLYNTSVKIDKSEKVHSFELNENDSIKIEKNGVINSAQFSEFSELNALKYDPNVYIEPDGSVWIRVFHHNNPASKLFSSSNDFANSVYIDEDRWFNFEAGNLFTSWEIMIKLRRTTGAAEEKYRWIQSVNPLTAVYADVDAADITKITTNGYLSTPHNGLYKKNSNTYLAANITGNSGYWHGAIGSWTNWNGGIPGYGPAVDATDVVSTGYEDVYIRIDNQNMTNSSLTKFKQAKSIIANEFIER